METVSKKRGRPEAIDPGWVKFVAGLHPELTSQRQIMAKCYECRAVGALNVDRVAIEGVSAIFDPNANVYRATVLEQLGRLKVENDWHDDDVRHIARIINQRFIETPELTARQAVAILKQARAACKREGQR